MGIFDGFGFGNNYAAPLMGFANSAQSALPGLDYAGALGNAAKGLPTQSPFIATNGNTGIVPPQMQQRPDGMPYQPATPAPNDLGGLPYQRTTPNPDDIERAAMPAPTGTIVTPNGNGGIVPPPKAGGLPYEKTKPTDPRHPGIGMGSAFAPTGGGGGIDGRAIGQNPFVTF